MFVRDSRLRDEGGVGTVEQRAVQHAEDERGVLHFEHGHRHCDGKQETSSRVDDERRNANLN